MSPVRLTRMRAAAARVISGSTWLTMRWLIFSWKSNTSARSPSKVWLQSSRPETASISRAVTRARAPARRTEPVTTYPACNASANAVRSPSRPLTASAPITGNQRQQERVVRISSHRPSASSLSSSD